MWTHISLFVAGAAAGMTFQRVLQYIMLDKYNPSMCDYCKERNKKNKESSR